MKRRGSVPRLEPYTYVGVEPRSPEGHSAWEILGAGGEHIAYVVGPEWVALDAVIAINRRVRCRQRITRVRLQDALQRSQT